MPNLRSYSWSEGASLERDWDRGGEIVSVFGKPLVSGLRLTPDQAELLRELHDQIFMPIRSGLVTPEESMWRDLASIQQALEWAGEARVGRRVPSAVRAGRDNRPGRGRGGPPNG